MINSRSVSFFCLGIVVASCGSSVSNSGPQSGPDDSGSITVSSDSSTTTTLSERSSTSTSTSTLAPTGPVKKLDCLALGERSKFIDSDDDGWGGCFPVTGSVTDDVVCEEGLEFLDPDRDGWGECGERVLSPQERAALLTSTEPFYRIEFLYGQADGFSVDCKITNTGKVTIEAFEVYFKVRNLFGRVMNEFGNSRFTKSFDQPLKSGRSVNCQDGYYWDLNPYDNGGAEMLNISNGRADVEVYVTRVLWADGIQFDWISKGTDVQIYPVVTK